MARYPPPEDAPVSELKRRVVETNGIKMHIAEQGEGPLVLLCHGFPEAWYSWRHQLKALADAGFHAVAPDQRGYGHTERPERIDAYTQLHLVGDMVGLLDALGEETAVVVGHDWGAPVAWNSALLRPDRFRAVAGLSVPYTGRGPIAPTKGLKAAFGDNFFYILYFQTPGVAEHELQKDVRRTMRMVLYSIAADLGPRASQPLAPQPLPKTASFLDQMVDPEKLPPWLTEADLDFFVAEFERTGFRGGLNWYRCMDLTWELMAPWAGAKIHQPALFITGDRDPVRTFAPAGDAMKALVPNLRDMIVLPGCGHWTQQERPKEVNEALISFLRNL
jgi:pimeloyl-ACP methyl ester carboxylesterase